MVGLSGSITAEPNTLVIEQLHSTEGITIDGSTLGQGPQGQRQWKIALDNVTIANAAVAVPEDIRTALGGKTPGGALSGTCRLNRIGSTDHNAMPWQVSADLSVQAGQIDTTLRMKHIDAELAVEAVYAEVDKQLDAEGQLQVHGMTLNERPVSDCDAQVVFATQNQEKILELNHLAGTLCRGRFGGNLSVQWGTAPAMLTTALQLQDADLAEMLEAVTPEGQRSHNLAGRLNGQLSAQFQPEMHKRKGTFAASVRDGVLGELPIAAQILHVLNLAIPKRGAFNSADMVGNITDTHMLFDYINLSGSAISLTGAGRMADANSVEMVFGIDPPRYMRNMPALNQMMQAVGSGVAQVRVTGSLSEPTVATVALPSLNDAIRQFLGRDALIRHAYPINYEQADRFKVNPNAAGSTQ